MNLTPISLSISDSYVPFLLFVVVLLGATVFVPPASAAGEPPVWRTSREMIKQSPASFPRLDQAGIEGVLKRLPKSLSLIPDYLHDKDAAVYLHKGDLTIDGSFDNVHTLVVDGNLTIRGSYDDYGDGIGILVVLGDMRAEHVISWGSIAVTGTLQATGLVYAYYNDFTFEVAGSVKARAMVVYDKATNDPHVDAPIKNNDGGGNTALAVRHFLPELMIEDVLDNTDAETTELAAVASYEVAQERIAAGQPIFRDAPGPESLAADVLRLFSPKVDAATMTRLAKADRLLAMVIATRETVPVAVQQQLAATNDAAILELLAKNPKADRAVLGKIAKTNAATAAAVARNPNAPAEAVSSLAASGDPETRIALLENPSVPVAALSRLAADKDAKVRKALTQKPAHLRRLPSADLARLVADADAEVRAALPPQDAVLTIEQLTVLARDKSAAVREKVAQALSQQALWQQVPVGTPEARAALSATLLADAAPAVRYAALRGASPAAQEQFVARLSGDEGKRAQAGIAQYTRSVPLMTRAINGEQYNAEQLARNLAITPALQMQLIARLQDPKTRTRISIVDFEALSKRAESWDAVIGQLVENPNATPEALLAVAKYCRAADGNAHFCIAMTHRDDLAAEAWEMLDGVGDTEEWALAVLFSFHATRAQIERAVRRWYDDEPEVLAAFSKLRSLPDSAFWNALARSKLAKLREIAAHNAATPPATLATLLRDPERDVTSKAASNPSTPFDALSSLATAAGEPAAVLENPRIPDVHVRRLLDRGLIDDDYSVIQGCKKVLAARALRAAS